jgi:hypothetical protein
MTGWLEVYEGLPDVSSPGGPLRWVDASVEVVIHHLGFEAMAEVTPETLTILQDSRYVGVAGEERQVPGRVAKDRRILTKPAVHRVGIFQEPWIVRIESHVERRT